MIASINILTQDATMNTQQIDSGSGDLAAVMRVARVVSAVIARSVANIEDAVTMAQLRVLVLVASRTDVNPSAVAAALGVHLSTASRICDRLVVAGWLNRQDSAVDRRNLILTLTTDGTDLLTNIMEYRRQAFGDILDQMAPKDRANLRNCFNRFADAADEPESLDYLELTPHPSLAEERSERN